MSKINKNKKQMKNILQELMNSLKFDYKEEQNKIDYKEFILMVFQFLIILNLQIYLLIV